MTRTSLLENYSKLDSSDLQIARDFGRQNENKSYNDSFDLNTDVRENESQQQQLHQSAPDSISRSQSPGSGSRFQTPGSVSKFQTSGGVSRSRTSTQSTQRSVKESEKSRSRASSRNSVHQSRNRSNTNDDNESVATEDFERVYKSTKTLNDSAQSSRFISDSTYPSRILHSTKRNSSKVVDHKIAHGPVKADHELFLFETNHEQHYVDETPKKHPQSKKHRKSNSMPGMPSGLPAYMYLRKEVGESDLGSDSIRTEDYEGLFATSMIPDEGLYSIEINFTKL